MSNSLTGSNRPQLKIGDVVRFLGGPPELEMLRNQLGVIVGIADPYDMEQAGHHADEVISDIPVQYAVHFYGHELLVTCIEGELEATGATDDLDAGYYDGSKVTIAVDPVSGEGEVTDINLRGPG